MARPKKAEEKAKDSASLQISVEDFVRTRDSVSSCSFHSFSRRALPPIPTRHHRQNNTDMGPTQLTVTFPDKYMVMPQPGRPMTRAQWEQAFQGVAFLTQSLKNVVNLGLASINTVQAAPNGMSNGLTYVPQVVTGLATLQSAVQDLSRAYIAHTNTVIGKGPGTQPELLNFNPLGGEPLFGNRAATPVPNVEGGETKKRKRAPHDKNAPKRPVTPYFLYMQTARSLIANEMPPGHTAKQVADEGTRRWLNMPDEEKKVSLLLDVKAPMQDTDVVKPRDGATSMASILRVTRKSPRRTKKADHSQTSRTKMPRNFTMIRSSLAR